MKKTILLLLTVVLIISACGGPSKEVREGKVAKKVFTAAHAYTYYVPIAVSTICSGKPTICTPIFVPMPFQGWKPDTWTITVVGCKRTKKDAVKTYCDKVTQRKVNISETEYSTLHINSDWVEHEA